MKVQEYRIEVKPWMTLKSSDGFDFMQKFNDDIPMPLVIMYTSGKAAETRGMVKMTLHGDIKERVTTRCMCCGRPITNKVSQFFGIGPICGEHNYVNPFDTEEELNEAVRAYREKLVNTVWTGWIAKSAIKSITDEDGNQISVDDLPTIVEKKAEPEAVAEVTKLGPTVTARIDKPIRCTDDFSVFLTFNYNKEIVASVKALRARFWDPDNKRWEIEYRELNELKSALPNINWVIENEEIVPDTVDVNPDFNLKTAPMAHQIEGILFGLDHSRFLLADEQGLGKTKQIIDLAVIRKDAQNFKHCLIVCGVNGLKWNWVEEIEKHSNESGYVLGQVYRKRTGKVAVGGNDDKISDLDRLALNEAAFPYFIITNIESLRDDRIASRLNNLCEEGIINMVAVDEIHRCKNLDTKQGQGMLKVQPTYRIGMTGTPLMNSPLDLYAILKWLGYQPYEFRQFKYHFCRFDEWGSVIGYKNIDQLREQLSTMMLRRRKDEVLDLPDKVYKNEYVDLTDEQKKLYNQVITDAIEDPELSEVIDNSCILALKMRLRQVSGGIGPFNFIKKNPKLDRLEQIVEEAVYSGTKVIVYSNWVGGISPAVERLQKYNPVVITGETKDAERQALVNKFQTDDSVKVICGTIGALGTGVTLTAATEVVFLDEPWTNADKEQAIDRCHRIGTTQTIVVHTLMSYGTYDEDVHDIVEGKKELSITVVEKKDLRQMMVA